MKTVRGRVTRRRAIIGALGLLLVVLLVAAACGEDATPTPLPATAVSAPTAAPAPTAVPAAPAPTQVPGRVVTATPAPAPTTQIRPIEEWTVENPATLEEIEAQLEKHRGENFVYAGWGGGDQAAVSAAWLEPFSEKFGIEIIQDGPIQYAKFRAMAETGNITWDVGNGSGQASWNLGQTDVLEELDFSIIDRRDFQEGSTSIGPWFGQNITWSNVVAYSNKAVDELWGGQAPKTMADIFDVEKFPGDRSFASPDWSWKTTLRFALLSEDPSLMDELGVPALAQLSPEQVDRAFEIMTEFAPHVRVWWTNGTECAQLIESEEVVICTSWNGSMFSAQQQGSNSTTCWECGHVMATNPWWIPLGMKEQDPNKFELLQLWMAWSSFPQQQANYSKFISNGPINVKAGPLMVGPDYDETGPEIPSNAVNSQFGIFEDEKFDGDNSPVIGERWVEWQQGL
ncbi:MAG: extracellular solute-binding protein [Dehalococcoidia bacterium]